jgi:PncC family amidohydrolase
VTDLLEALTARQMTLAVAEGDTGGLLLQLLTAVPGSSAIVLGGVVAYADSLKRDVLGVSADLIREHGAVSGEVAEAMAVGIRRLAGSDVGVATTGIAGPGGATLTKPVGLAYIAAVDGSRCLVREHRWHGDRTSNRQSSARAAIKLALEFVAGAGGKWGV